ncbi:MAG: ATP phosphoribosyltransferase regulatory subunit [Pseudomonadales bacterium]|nr:ATP phosphoribosyltransferase regulatory subunit [Pseudomonadales bacterium]
MTDSNRWLLPDGIEEVLPPQAWRAETLRRKLLDLYRSWGYELVIPPYIEYLESLLTGIGSDLDLQTFKVTDQLTGRLMGIRADMTPQVARIDAHSLQHQGPARFCYGGSVLHTRAPNILSTRSPIQMGAELFGCADIAADSEIINLMLETIKLAGAENIHLDLGHVGIYRGLVSMANLSEGQETELFDLLQSKAKADVERFVAENVSAKDVAQMLSKLVTLNGGYEVLREAREVFQKAPESVSKALDMLDELGQLLASLYPEVDLYFDLAELRGYQYHTSMVYSAYVSGFGQAIAKGGRYDHIGEVFGRSRAATGFSADLKALTKLNPAQSEEKNAIVAPRNADPALALEVFRLRNEGEIVVYQLSEDIDTSGQFSCDRRLVLQGNQWVVESI